MRLSASSFYTFYRPSPCPLRVFLVETGVTKDKPSPYEEVVVELGRRYEAAHVATLKNVINAAQGDEDERAKHTAEAIEKGAEAIYRPLFKINRNILDRDVTLVGEPDLLIREDGEYVIRDVKLSRRITEKDHPEILFQLGMYGWLFEETLKQRPKRLEVLAGTGKIEQVPAAFIERAQLEAKHLVGIRTAKEAPFSAVGWTKCTGCSFNSHCWMPAVNRKLAAIVPGVDQGLALALYDAGIRTVDDLLKVHTESSLAELKRPWGKGSQKVGKGADKILRCARAIVSGNAEVLQKPDIPAGENYVMFDLEGLPPQLDELDKIYLWGMQVFGKDAGQYMGKIAAIGQNGDLAGWEGFLESAKSVFDVFGDIPFVHWHHYEKTKINTYIERYGDKEGIAERVKRNLLDLLPRAQTAVALPLPSYSLKVVEKYIAFERTQDEYGGDWSMATFIKATETQDEAKRKELLDSILTYNREDLAATWAVFQWLANVGGKTVN